MKQLYEIRKSHGDVFVTAFEDGLIVPWRPLNIGDYIKYSHDRERGLIPVAQLEDEIFKKAVVDDSILRQMPYLKAGTVSTVVINVWQFSGPTGVKEFNDDLEVARQVLNSNNARALHELVQVISVAFPYKPEEIYAMDYETFLLRTAQAEKKLLQLGIYLQEPISLQLPDDKTSPKSKLGKIPQEKPDAKKLWEQQQKSPPQPQPHKHRLKSEDVKTLGDKWWTKSPVLEAPNKHNINFKEEAAEHSAFALTGHEKADIHIEAAKMVKDAEWIYADLIKDLGKRKKR